MAVWTQKDLERHAESVLSLFDDGFQFDDVFQIVPRVMEIVAEVEGSTGAEKKAMAIMLGEYLIDKTDIWGPDAIIDPICKRLLPGAIQLAWDAYRQRFKFESD